MKLILIRHGQTQWNRQNRIQGWLDSPLTEAAKRQLAALQLGPLANPIIYCSDLERSYLSAAIIARNLNCEVIQDPRLRERCFGPLDGQVIGEAGQLSAHWAAYHRRYLQPIAPQYKAESESAFEARIISFIDELMAKATERDVVVVGHGEWLRALLNLAQGRPSWVEGCGVGANAEPLSMELEGFCQLMS